MRHRSCVVTMVVSWLRRTIGFGRKKQNMVDSTENDLRCDVLLLFSTSTEEEELRAAAADRGIPFERRKTVTADGQMLKWMFMGTIGCSRVNAAKTQIGPFCYGGSAGRALYLRTLTGATAIIQVGMAFGVDPGSQKIGDVLISTSVIPYDRREVRPVSQRTLEMPADVDDDFISERGTSVDCPADRMDASCESAEDESYRVTYHKAVRYRAKMSLVTLFDAERQRGGFEHGVILGGVLSGGARIFSRKFVRELVEGVPSAEDGVIGGEMEAVGLLSVSPEDNPVWIVVKGISDFADVIPHEMFEKNRLTACRNAARFVLSALGRTAGGS